MKFLSNYILPHDPINNDEPLYITTAGHYERLPNHIIHREHGEIANESIIIFCLNGEGWLETEDGLKKVLPGMMLYCDKGVAHAYGSNPNMPWDIYWAHFGGPFTDYYAKALRLQHSAGTVLVNNLIAIKPLMQQLLSTISQPMNTLQRMKAYSQLRLILIKTLALNQTNVTFDEDDSILTRSVALMTEHLFDSLDLEYLASHVNLSKYHYTREFKRMAGVSPMKYYTTLKIEHAKTLLLSSDHNISEISRVLNFNTPYYFSETFKNHTGFSPRAYKQLHRKQF